MSGHESAPAGTENTWDRMVPGKSWYTWFRLYGPLEAYFDQSWPLPGHRAGEVMKKVSRDKW